MKSKSVFFCCLFIFSLKSTAQWKQLQLPDNNYALSIAMDVTDSKTCLIAMNGGNPPGLFLTKNDGNSFVTFNNFLNSSESIEDVAVVDTLNFWVATQKRILNSADGGKTWTTQFTDSKLTDFINYIEMFDLKNGIAMADPIDGSSKTLILKTTNGGNNWINANESLIGMSSGDAWRRIDFVNMNIGYFYETNVNPQITIKTSDGGRNWENIKAPVGIQVLKFFNEEIGATIARNIISENPKIYVTKDGGKNWSSSLSISNAWGNDIEFIPGNPGKIIAANYNNVYSSVDTGKTWMMVKVPNELKNIREIEFADDKVGYILCDNGKLFKTENAGYLSTGLDNKIEISDEFILSQNYPNPFNPSTTISWQISTASHVTLKVYDLLGKEVATLVDEYKQPGNYNSTFTSIQGFQLPSGCYFYKLNSGNYQSVKKMMLTK